MHNFTPEILTALLAGAATVSAATPPAKYKAAPVPTGSTYYGDHDFVALSKSKYFDSPHFRIYNTTRAQANGAIQHLEGAWDCFVKVLGWRDSGVSIYNDTKTGPWWKVNVFSTAPLPGVLGYMTSDYRTGLGYEVMLDEYLNRSSVVVHEFGHVLTYGYAHWWNQTNANGWAETIANYVGETYNTSPLCAASRAKTKDAGGWTLFQPRITMSLSYLTLIDATPTGNDYYAWPFLSYLTTNLDKFPGLGTNIMKKLFNTYKVNSNETPLHTLQRILGPKRTVQQLVTRYWARMAYADFNSTMMYTNFFYVRNMLDYNNLDTTGKGVYRVKAAKAPRYLGASIIPLNATVGKPVTVRVASKQPFSASVSIKRNTASLAVRYLDLQVVKAANVVRRVNFTLAEGEEAMLTVVNTPKELLMYNARETGTGEVAEGLDYNVTLRGAVAGFAS
ncbi:hypothetical protein C1H76_7266 [Elsinoe australis]|uniref:Uncharacterized protein n=1 Tax=Elsinoe australis TaxID=40998 RepID=A0A4U7AVH9_9PEZI|nr:hypothetical protein C1H76_7266 [Elsinoe australis]